MTFAAADYFVSSLVTLLLVVDPVGLVPVFVALTHRLPRRVRLAVATRACIAAAAILVGAALVGDWLLANLGISISAFRIAGGLLLFSIASEMVLGVRTERQSKTAEQALDERVHHIAAFPLAIPLMAGPGAITATILLAGQAAGRPTLLALLLVVAIAVIGICFAAFVLSTRIDRWLGMTGNIVLSRLLGVILAALAVQYVVDGIRGAFSSA